MKKQVILFMDAENAPGVELLEGLSSAGISVLAHDLTEIAGGRACAGKPTQENNSRRAEENRGHKR